MENMENSLSVDGILLWFGSISIVCALQRLRHVRGCKVVKQDLVATRSGNWKVGSNQSSPYGRNYYSYDPKELLKSGSMYSLLISSIVPRPIALVSSQNKNGIQNCAPFSYFNMILHDPPMIVLGLCTQGRKRLKKDTLVNIEETGEFVVNIMSTWFVESANHTSGNFPAEVDEMQVAGLSKVNSVKVSPPRVGESAVQFECMVRELMSI